MAVKDHDWFVGEMGQTFEADGFTRIGGRLFGLLLLAERPLSLDEIAEQLRVSKASVSTDARRMHEKGVLERSGKPGDRRDYWEISPDFFSSIMRLRVERWRKLNALVGEFKRRAPNPAESVRARLRDMEDVYDYISIAVDDALLSWQGRRAKKPKAAKKPAKRSRAA